MRLMAVLFSRAVQEYDNEAKEPNHNCVSQSANRSPCRTLNDGPGPNVRDESAQAGCNFQLPPLRPLQTQEPDSLPCSRKRSVQQNISHTSGSACAKEGE